MSTASDLAAMAISAVRDYEHWHAEVARLTAAISECECPHPKHAEPEFGTEAWELWNSKARHSCFDDASGEQRRAWDGEPLGRIPLADVRKAVADCPSCVRLCDLVAERWEAKKKRAAAKRYVRRVGKIALRPEVAMSEARP